MKTAQRAKIYFLGFDNSGSFPEMHKVHFLRKKNTVLLWNKLIKFEYYTYRVYSVITCVI